MRSTIVRRALATGAVAIGPAFIASQATAQIVNGSFEQPTLPTGVYQSRGIFGVGSTGIPGWTVVGSGDQNVMLLGPGYSEVGDGGGGATLVFNPHDGVQSLDLTGDGNRGLGAGVQQSVTTTLGQNYLLQFFVGRAAGLPNLYDTPSSLLLAVNGATVGTFTNANATPNAVNWLSFTYSFTATSASTVFQFTNATAGANNNEVGLDGVMLTAVPEPSTCALVMAGVAGVGAVARRRRRTATA